LFNNIQILFLAWHKQSNLGCLIIEVGGDVCVVVKLFSASVTHWIFSFYL